MLNGPNSTLPGICGVLIGHPQERPAVFFFLSGEGKKKCTGTIIRRIDALHSFIWIFFINNLPCAGTMRDAGKQC